MGRGKLTEEIKAYSLKALGHEISQKELRLIPYFQYTMVNDRKFDRRKINDDERAIIAIWRKLGYIEGTVNMTVDKNFWDIICEILYMSYANF